MKKAFITISFSDDTMYGTSLALAINFLDAFVLIKFTIKVIDSKSGEWINVFEESPLPSKIYL